MQQQGRLFTVYITTSVLDANLSLRSRYHPETISCFNARTKNSTHAKMAEALSLLYWVALALFYDCRALHHRGIICWVLANRNSLNAWNATYNFKLIIGVAIRDRHDSILASHWRANSSGKKVTLDRQQIYGTADTFCTSRNIWYYNTMYNLDD